MSRVLPILFNTQMVQAILDGRKTTTRRVMKNQDYIADNKQPYRKGDILYVRETWNICNMDIEDNSITFIYKADKSEEQSARTVIVPNEIWDQYNESMAENNPDWRPSIHMPKEAARIWLRVTDVRAERLREITENGTRKEGIHFSECPDGFTWKECTDIHNCYTTSIGAMQALWDSTIKKSDLDRYGWNANPWVWVIEFERCERPKEVE